MASELRVLSEEEATTVERPEHEAWKWPEPVFVMISDSYKVNQKLSQRAVNGDPLEYAFALNFLESLYANGWVVAKRVDA
jgi:hypothetical protein